MSIRLVDLLDARSHEAGELEEGNAGRDRERGECVTESVGRTVLEARRPNGGRPLVSPPFVEVQQAATNAREEQRRVEPRGNFGQRLRGSERQRNGSQRTARFPVALDLAISEDAANVHDGRLAV